MILRRSILFVIAVIFITAAISAPVSANDENFLVMYIVGADLEYTPENPEIATATVNMDGLVSNWDESIGDVLVFYGGSEKTGWNDGVSVTNLELLKEDLKDNSMGVDVSTGLPTEFIIGKIDGDITSADVLHSSMSYVKEYASENNLNSAKSTLIFWNHGGGYDGFGYPSTSDNHLKLDDLKFGLSDSKYDIIAFDACFMGSLEVADSIYPYCDYLVGSEEEVPGSGYNYAEFAEKLSSNPSMSSESFAKSLVDAFSHSSAQGKTLSVLKSDKTPSVVSALNNLGDSLYSSIQNYPDSVTVIADIYDSTQKYTDGIDLYQFAEQIYDNSDGDVKINAGSLISALNSYVICSYGDPKYSGGSNGVTVAGFSEKFKTQIPNEVVFGRNGWYNYLSAMTDLLDIDSAESQHSGRSISVSGSVWSTTALGDFLYVKDGEYVIIGQVPLDEIYKNGDDVWNKIPTGEYEEPEWDGGWFSFGSTGTGIFASMNYDYSVYIDGDLCYVYQIYGDLTRKVNDVSVTRPSMITAVINMDKMKVEDIYVNSIDTENPEFSVRSNDWISTDILEGDVFNPQIDIYDEDSSEISSKLSAESFTFTGNVFRDLSYKELNDDNVYWVAEILDYVDDDSVYLEEEKVPEAKKAQSPLSLFTLAAGLGAAVFFLRRN